MARRLRNWIRRSAFVVCLIGFCLLGCRSAWAMANLTSADMRGVSGGVNNMCKRRLNNCNWGTCTEQGDPCTRCSLTLQQWACKYWNGLNCDVVNEEGGCGYEVEGATCSSLLVCVGGVEGLEECDRLVASGTICPC